jgi:hypothetical protein
MLLYIKFGTDYRKYQFTGQGKKAKFFRESGMVRIKKELFLLNKSAMLDHLRERPRVASAWPVYNLFNR